MMVSFCTRLKTRVEEMSKKGGITPELWSSITTITTQIDVLLRRLNSSYTSWADKNEAGKEICYLTKHSEYARAHFGETPNSFDPLFDILWYKDMDEHPDLREHLVTTFYNISLDGRYKKKLFLDMDLTRTKIGFHLGRNLVHGTIESRRIAAATISSIYAAAADDDHDHDSSISEMKYFEGSKFLNGLISLLEYGDDLAAKDAITAIIKLCIFPYNRLCVVNRGIIRLILEKLSRGILVDELLDLLDSLSPEWRTVAIEELVNKSKKAVPLLFGMLKNNNNISEVKKQQCLSVLVKMCKYDDQGTTLMELKKEIVKLLDLKNNNNNEDISEVIKKDQCLSILLEMCKNGEGTTLKEIVVLDLKNNEDITAKAT